MCVLHVWRTSRAVQGSLRSAVWDIPQAWGARRHTLWETQNGNKHELLTFSQKQGARRHCPLFTSSEAPWSNSWHPSHQETPGEWEEARTLILIQSPFFTPDLTSSSPFSVRLQHIRGSFSVHLSRKAKQSSSSPPEGSRKRKTPGAHKHSAPHHPAETALPRVCRHGLSVGGGDLK